MFAEQKKNFQLTAAVLTVCLAGCISIGSKYVEVKDPFVAPTETSSSNGLSKAAAPRDLPEVTFTTEQHQAASEVRLAAYTTGENHPPKIELLLEPKASSAEKSISRIPTGASPVVISEDVKGQFGKGVFPIDLGNALGLGGADNLQVRLARTRLFQAQAKHLEAKTLWLPSIRFGVGYNKHDGRLQETEGNVLEINRNSLYYGGGLGLGNAPLAAGAGGPPRMFVNLSLADAYFKPLSAYQEVAARGAAERVATNDSLAQIAIAYHSLVEAFGQLANANAARDLSQNMMSLVENFEREGFSSKTEVQRARTDLGRWQRDVADAERQTVVRSAELARILRLPAQVQLVPVEEFVLPIEFVDASMEVEVMIAMAHRARPEIVHMAARREAACFRVKEEKWRPWVPSVQVGASGGNFGGGPSADYLNQASRSDLDVIAVWEWKNMGMGNMASQRQRRGELHERVLELEVIRDRIASEVVAAAADVTSYRRQTEIAQESIVAAQESYELNQQRVRANEGLPIELLQAISALADARSDYTEAVGNYNRSQYRLIRAMGNMPG